MVFCFLCPKEPPSEVKAKGGRGAAQNAMLVKQNNPNIFALGLKDACCAEPVCCIASSMGAPFGCTACWARKSVLEKCACRPPHVVCPAPSPYFTPLLPHPPPSHADHKGIDDFMCCQGYFGQCCCLDTTTFLKGSPVGLCLEGCCCPMFSLSIARIHLMDSKQMRPDPCDWQIIACSNFLQFISCILDIIAIFVKEAREAAIIVDLIADLFTCSVAGCMGAQVYHEIKKDADGIKYLPAMGVPVVHGHAPGAPESEEMAR